MCGLFGFSRYGAPIKYLSELTNSLAQQSAVRGTDATGRLLFSIISSLAAFERETLIERTNEGLAAARARGQFGGRPKTDEATVKKAVALYHTGQYTLAEITSLTDISKSTLYRVLKRGI